MAEKIDSITYIIYFKNIIKNLKMLYYDFSEEEVTSLKNLINSLNNNDIIKFMFLQTFIKYGLTEKDEEDNTISNIDSLPLTMNQYFSKVYISILEDIIKYLHQNSQYPDAVILQIKTIEQNFENRIIGVNNVDPNMEVPAVEQNEINKLMNLIIHSTQFSTMGNVSKLQLSEDIEPSIQIAESSIIGPKHLGLQESDVKNIIELSEISKEVNEDLGFYNYGSDGLGYYN